MPHCALARRQATAVPLVLFGDHGRTVEGYMPATEDLELAVAPKRHRRGDRVRGPHLLTARAFHARNKTGIVGISLGFCRTREKHYFYVNLGSSHRKFCIETLGRTEALRRAIALRVAHLEKLALANAAIIAARQRNTEAK